MYSTIKKELGRLLKKIQKRRNDIMQMLKDGMTLDATNKSFADEFFNPFSVMNNSVLSL